GDQVLTFRPPIPISREPKTDLLQRTLREIENIPCWLLVADILGFTRLTRQMQSEDLEVLVGAWIFTCKEIIESRHGIVNKYLGDGFLAYWPEAGTSAEEIVSVIFALRDLQQKKLPEFRFVVRFGPAAVGGVVSMRAVRLVGGEENLLLRLERLACSLGQLA